MECSKRHRLQHASTSEESLEQVDSEGIAPQILSRSPPSNSSTLDLVQCNNPADITIIGNKRTIDNFYHQEANITGQSRCTIPIPRECQRSLDVAYSANVITQGQCSSKPLSSNCHSQQSTNTSHEHSHTRHLLTKQHSITNIPLHSVRRNADFTLFHHYGSCQRLPELQGSKYLEKIIIHFIFHRALIFQRKHVLAILPKKIFSAASQEEKSNFERENDEDQTSPYHGSLRQPHSNRFTACTLPRRMSAKFITDEHICTTDDGPCDPTTSTVATTSQSKLKTSSLSSTQFQSKKIDSSSALIKTTDGTCIRLDANISIYQVK